LLETHQTLKVKMVKS